MQAITTGWPFMVPEPTRMASVKPVFFCAASSRTVYGLVSLNSRGSAELNLGAISRHFPSSNSKPKYASLPMRSWWSHMPQTHRLLAWSCFDTTVLQLGHWYHAPSGISFFSALDVVMPSVFLLNHPMRQIYAGGHPDPGSLRSVVHGIHRLFVDSLKTACPPQGATRRAMVLDPTIAAP